MGYSSTMYSPSADVMMSNGVMEAIVTFLRAFSFFMFVIAILMIIARWRIFTKAGEAGWKSIIPFYNGFVQLKISGLSPWLYLLFFAGIIPFVGPLITLIFAIYALYRLAASFGKGVGFTIGLIFLSPIFMLILAFGSAQYVGNNNPVENTTNA